MLPSVESQAGSRIDECRTAEAGLVCLIRAFMVRMRVSAAPGTDPAEPWLIRFLVVGGFTIANKNTAPVAYQVRERYTIDVGGGESHPSNPGLFAAQ